MSMSNPGDGLIVFDRYFIDLIHFLVSPFLKVRIMETERQSKIFCLLLIFQPAELARFILTRSQELHLRLPHG